MREETSSETSKSKAGKKVAIIIIILLFIAAIIVVIYLFMIKKEDIEVTPSGSEIAVIDDFYHAKDGRWKIETTIHLLKEKKFVSSDTELKNYLVYTAKPGKIVRIAQAAGRWKYLEVEKDGKVIASGWADAEDGKAERQKEVIK